MPCWCGIECMRKGMGKLFELCKVCKVKMQLSLYTGQ